MHHLSFSRGLFPHIFAAGIGLQYAWFVSQSVYVKTGLQFVAPLLVIMGVHLIWITFTRGLSPGFSSLIYQRSAQSSVGVALVLLFASIVAPKPAVAGASDVVQMALTVIVCVLMVVVVVGVLAGLVYVFFKTASAAINELSSSDKQDPDSRLFDFGSLGVTTIFLGLCSLEGLPNAYTFATQNHSTASYFVDASPDHVWQTMEQATSPNFPLPDLLNLFPRPVDVVIDEGSTLGSIRKVEFQGREGTGYLTLRVTERSDTIAVFEVQSDTTPYAGWVAYQRLIYKVRPEGSGTRLMVTLEYDRLLAPSWFFTPMVKGSGYLAMGVLARDVKSRAEG